MIKKVIAFFALIFFVTQISAQTKTKGNGDDDDDDDKETVPARHVNRVISSKVDSEFDKNKDKGEGPYKEFLDNKKLAYEGTYKNYKEVAFWKRFYESGILS